MKELVSFLLFLAAMALSLSLPANAQSYSSSLPPVFAPLRWDTDPKDLKRLFPGADVERIEYRTGQGRQLERVFLISKIRREPFGEALITVREIVGTGITLMEIATSEERPECHVFEVDTPPTGCRNRYSPALVKAFRSLEHDLLKLYGKPSATISPGRDPREMSRKWALSGLNLFLALDRGEEQGDWRVSLAAQR